MLTLTAASPREKRPSSAPLPTLGNYPATSIPLSANTTVTPDAAPTNATRMNVSASTNFKGKLEADPATGVVQVTDAHPAGTYTVTVKAFDNGGGNASTTFNLTVRNSEACDPPSFAAANNFPAGLSNNAVAVGDFNRDGIQDLAVAHSISLPPTANRPPVVDGAPPVGGVSILLGNGAGGFALPATFPVASTPVSIAVGDFNGDGRQDLVTANQNSSNVSILLGSGAGSFGVATNFPLGTIPRAVVVGDFNGDGRQDLAVCAFNNNVLILLGDGAGSFGLPAPFPVGDNPFAVAVGDFNGDGKQDLAVANFGSSNVSILLGNGAGGFSASTNFIVGTSPEDVAVGDFNGDGKQDLATANFGSSNISILLGDGMGNFGTATNFSSGTAARFVVVGDFNGDGNQDLATSTSGVAMLLGNGAGNFGAPIDLETGTLPVRLAVGDFNGDARQDLAVCKSSTVSVFMDNCPLSLGTYPDTSIPLSTDTTVTPNAPPAGITRMTVSSSTDFKGKLEGDPTTGVVRITDAHPAGTHTITVTGFDSMGVRTSTSFALTVTTRETCNPVGFAAAINFGAGTNPTAVAVGDFNRDGIQDVAVANQSSNNVSILLGNGSGSFNGATNFGAGGSPVSVAVGDFNRDGIQDLVAGNPFSGNISILLGDGSGGFSAPTSFGADAFPSFVVVGDFNRDGKPDLAVLPQNGTGVSILVGDGAGNFGAPTHFNGGSQGLNLVVGDFNRDGKQDLAVLDFSQSRVAILLGDGAGSFGAPTYFSTGTQLQFIALGDFNGDGSQDLAVGATTPAGPLRILLGDGFGSFGAPMNVSAGGVSFRSMAVGDFNGDGSQDIALTDSTPRLVVVRLGDGAGNFGAPINFSTGGGSNNPVSIAVGDFNGDGRQDLVTASNNSANVSILLRNCAPVLDASKSPMLNDEPQNSGPPVGAVGTLISSLVDFAIPPGQVDNVTDEDNGALLGIAVTAADTSNGVWFYSIDSGASWNSLGAVSGSSARLLAVDFQNTRLYFQPNANFNGTLPSAITFRAWDQTSGTNGMLANTSPNGGGSAFSIDSDTASLTVTGTNQCTVCHKHTATLTLPCNSLEYQRHLGHGDTEGPCPLQSNKVTKTIDSH